MNFVQQLEECLRDLAAAARQRHPGVKEASERAVLKLRSLQSGYVSAVRKAASSKDHPTTSLFQSSDLLHPFLLAANYPTADYKLLEISFRAMRLLMEADAVVPSDGIHMVRVYQIQAVVVTAYYQKQYAKEIQKSAANSRDEEDDEEDAELLEGSVEQQDSDSIQSDSAPVESTGGSSWFGWGSSSSAKPLNPSQHGGKIKNAVSSSTGQTGQAALSASQMEKLALEILSSLLQLMELLRNHPSSLTSTELWTSATALACLWFYLPARHTVLQAAHSTVSQLISLLYQTENNKLIQSTWDDLLTLTESERTKRSVVLQGAFKLCKRKADNISSSAALPPSPEFALELMTQLWKENNAVCYDIDLIKSMGVTMTLLQRLPKMTVEKSLRVIQWTLVLFQSQANSHPNECRELFLQLIKQITLATDACRKHHDFEDGYVYSVQQQSEVFLLISASMLHEDATNGVQTAAAKEMNKRRSVSESLSSAFPLTVLWKAGFVLEATYHILDKDSNELSVIFEDIRTVQSLAEALSDFATIGTSCRDHILQVVGFCQMQDPSSIKPTVFRKGEHGIAAGVKFSDVEINSLSKSADKSKSPIQILGETIWLSLQGILRIGDCLRCLALETDRKNIFDDIFPPSLAVLQHFLKRFIGSDELVQLALKGYSTLADICLPMNECTVERKILLTSLSKLSLPFWGKHDTSCQLQDHHVRSLLCLLRIVHLYSDMITTEWEIVFWTFEELSMLDIASPLLTDEAYHASLAISAVYARFASFSTCFSDESLTHVTEALSVICEAIMANRDVVGDSETVLPERTNTSELSDKGSTDERETISGKIMSIGVRAIYGSDLERHDETPRLERPKKAYYEDYRQEFVGRISSSKYSLRTNSIGRIPFALVLFSDIAMANVFRSKMIVLKISMQFSRLAAASPVIRPLVMDLITMLMISQLSPEQDLPQVFKGPGRVVFDDPMQSQLLAVVPVDTSATEKRDFSQAEVLAPLCDTIQTVEKADVAKASLDVLNTILERTGQNLNGEVWSLMIDALASLSGDSSYYVGRSSSEWSACCLIAFRSLKLIVDDFLGQLPGATDAGATAHISLLDCCSSFVVSRHDINTSLTAIGLLWTIADQDSDSASIDRALSKLVLLSSDDRPEVRNAAVNTLFSCIAGRGGGFSPSYWESCITSTVFGVYDIVSAKAGAGLIESETDEKAVSKYQVRLHHSRDSSGKMWVATQVLVLHGLTRVLRIFFLQLFDTIDTSTAGTKAVDASWFQGAWERIIGFAFEAASQDSSRDNLDIRSVGVELLVVCCQLASKAGIQAAVAPARVSTNMEVVNGALRSVRESQPSKVLRERTQSDATDFALKKLFLGAFESLEAFEGKVLKARIAEDDTDHQILNKFCANLGRLYECCRENEFKVDNTTRSLQGLLRYGQELNNTTADGLEARFVRIVVSVLSSSGGDAKARFLNQGQRGSLDLLRTMASHGSSASFDRLVFFAGPSFFIRKDSDSDESDNGEDFGKHTHMATLLNSEAAAAVSQEICKGDVSDECKAFVLYMVLVNFLTEQESHELRQRRNYKRLVPIVSTGVEGVARLAGREDVESLKAAAMVWTQLLKSLTQMLTPVPLGKDLIKIPRISEIMAIVACTIAEVPRSHATDLCRILSFGASQAFDAAKQHGINAEAVPESDFGRKSKKHRDDLLKLFFTCFSGSCALGPEEPILRSIADTVLSGAENMTNDSFHSLCTEASLLVCRAIKGNEKTETLIVSLFPALCRLIMSDSSKLKEAAGTVLKGANIAETLRTFQSRYELAETRAIDAELRVAELEATVDDLQRAKMKLQKELKVAQESRRGLWNLG